MAFLTFPSLRVLPGWVPHDMLARCIRLFRSYLYQSPACTQRKMFLRYQTLANHRTSYVSKTSRSGQQSKQWESIWEAYADKYKVTIR